MKNLQFFCFCRHARPAEIKKPVRKGILFRTDQTFILMYRIISQIRHICNVDFTIYRPKKCVRNCIPYRTPDRNSKFCKEDNI